MNVKPLYMRIKMKNLYSLFLALIPFILSAKTPADFVTYVPSDVYSVVDYQPSGDGVKVCIYDWYDETKDWYYCAYENDWCYPEFYPTLAVRYGTLCDQPTRVADILPFAGHVVEE